MSHPARLPLHSFRAQRGFTLVELMVTVGIALFLLGGLVTIMQNVRSAALNQQKLSLLGDEQRFALTVITDAVQTGGYFSNPLLYTTASFPAAPTIAPAAALLPGWVFSGSHVTGTSDALSQDTIVTRFQTDLNYGPILCDGTDTSTIAGPNFYQIQFGIDPAKNQLWCSVNNGAPIALVTGVTGMAVYYGIKRNTALADYNVDTYVTWDQFDAGNPAEYDTISSVRIVLTFANPLAGQGTQPATVTTERVIEVMGRAGQHT
jgi:prepilin-type N-terminal cleavage/methylation domain-containing protein